MDTKTKKYIRFSLMGVAMSVAFFLVGTATSFFKGSNVEMPENRQSNIHRIEDIQQIDKAVQRLESNDLSLEKKNRELQEYIESVKTQLSSLSRNQIPNSQKQSHVTESIQKGSLLQEKSITDDTEHQTIEEALDQAELELNDQFSLLEDTVANEEPDPE